MHMMWKYIITNITCILPLILRKCVSTFITCKYFICQNDVGKKNRDQSDENFRHRHRSFWTPRRCFHRCRWRKPMNFYMKDLESVLKPSDHNVDEENPRLINKNSSHWHRSCHRNFWQWCRWRQSKSTTCIFERSSHQYKTFWRSFSERKSAT